MLRGINLAGHKSIKMESLRKSFLKLGLRNVITYIQSGNVVFETRKKSIDGLAKAIGNQILRDSGFRVPVLLKTATEMGRIIRENPFAKETGIDHSKLHVTFLSETA